MDDEFYNNRDILNGNITPSGVTYSTANNRHAKHIRKLHEKVIDNIQVDGSFVPIKMPNLACRISTILITTCDIKNPISFFELFFGEE